MTGFLWKAVRSHRYVLARDYGGLDKGDEGGGKERCVNKSRTHLKLKTDKTC